MEHILISPGKLKLTLTKRDVERYELDSTGGEDIAKRGSFKELLSDVKAVSGFDAEGGRVFIQLFPSKDGGAELYITRLTPSSATGDGEVKLYEVYAFAKFGDMLAGCRLIGDRGGKWSAWQGSDGCYLLWERSAFPKERQYREKREVAQLFGELGRHVADSAARFYLAEHCECICPDSAEKLGRFA